MQYGKYSDLERATAIFRYGSGSCDGISPNFPLIRTLSETALHLFGFHKYNTKSRRCQVFCGIFAVLFDFFKLCDVLDVIVAYLTHLRLVFGGAVIVESADKYPCRFCGEAGVKIIVEEQELVKGSVIH